MLGNSEKFCRAGAQNIYVCGTNRWEQRYRKGGKKRDRLHLFEYKLGSLAFNLYGKGRTV